MTVVIAKTQILAELQPGADLCLHVGAAEPGDLFQLILGTIDIVHWVSCQPVQVVELLSGGMRSVCRREDQCRTDDTRILRVGALEIRDGIGEILACAYFQPVGDMAVDVHTEVITLETSILDDTLLIGVAT